MSRFLMSLAALCGFSSATIAQEPAINPKISIEQKEFFNNPCFSEIIATGRHLFSTPYTPEDGYGEGIDGPRRSYQNLSPRASYPFLRLNGLDSQSCFECHNSIGSDLSRDNPSKKPEAQSRKIGVNGGSAGFASNAFINPDFGREESSHKLVKFIRNPPHVFGTGYIQNLSDQISLELLAQIEDTREIAESITSQPGNKDKEIEFRVWLFSFSQYDALNEFQTPGDLVKDINNDERNVNSSFGEYVVKYQNGKMIEESERVLPIGFLPQGSTNPGDRIRNRNAAGVSRDGVVRPLQWKGIASSERNFVKDALNFHFGIQPEELFYERDPRTPTTISITEHDNDADGKRDEMKPGNVTALTVFTMSVRPPVQMAHLDSKRQESAERGMKFFMGHPDSKIPQGSQTCASCHIPCLTLKNSIVSIIDPTDPANLPEQRVVKPGLSSQFNQTEDLPIKKRFLNFEKSFKEAKANFPELLRSQKAQIPTMESAQPPGRHFDFDLNMPLNDDHKKSLPLSYPRLVPAENNTIQVPLFSDLRRHQMGDKLAELDDVLQETDVKEIFVPENNFLTRPLWGVADTGPWLHDGRALTLKDAVLAHESRGSEANPILNYIHSQKNKDQILEDLENFLLTLRLPPLGDGNQQYQADDQRIWKCYHKNTE